MARPSCFSDPNAISAGVKNSRHITIESTYKLIYKWQIINCNQFSSIQNSGNIPFLLGRKKSSGRIPPPPIVFPILLLFQKRQ